ncbi:MAG: acyltransferase [Nitrospira sp.]|nr:acyltransferase [Nitrospira sp.]
MGSHYTTTPSYRPDIDGLRAIAVLSVLLYHFGCGLFSGGFVGVDIFFVISGFLITRLLEDEIARTGRLGFGSFYLRRARRLLPALFVTLAGSTIFALWHLSPMQLANYSASLISAIFSASNIYFYSVSGYFDTASIHKPLLHTWSLGVEEQFYLLWPIIFVLLSLRAIPWVLFATGAGLASLYLAQSMLVEQADAVFYLVPFRFFEFSIGALQVWLMRIQPGGKALQEFSGTAGLVLIAYSVVSYDAAVPFPGYSALAPCIGAALCIYAGRSCLTGAVLSNRVLVGVGLISYSLYLVHWPLTVFYKDYIGGREFSFGDMMFLACASCTIATIMYHYVEKPVRRGTIANQKFLMSCATFSFMTSLLGASMWATGGWEWRSWAASQTISADEIERGRERRFHIREHLCQEKGWNRCDAPIPGKINALIIGDSHAADALNAFHHIYPTHNFSMSAHGGCPPTVNVEKLLPNHPYRESCRKLTALRFDPAYLRKFDYLVINVLFGWYTPNHLREYLEFLHDNQIPKVIVLGDYLTLNRDMYEILNEDGYNTAAIMRAVVVEPDRETILRTKVSSLGYFFLSKRSEFCRERHCDLFDTRRIPFTYDTHHLSYEFSTRLAAGSKHALDHYLNFQEQ